MSTVPRSKKEFVLKSVFKDAPTFEEGEDYYSIGADYSNVDWSMSVKRRSNYLDICEPNAPPDKWSIQTKIEFKVVGSNQNDVIETIDCCYEDESVGLGISNFLEWEKVENEYLVSGNLPVEAKVTIIETTGLGKEKIRKFDESQEHVSDVILVVRNTKFHVLKMYLAVQSIFFKALFFGNSPESKESKVRLAGVDPNDFHRFLEVLYGECVIDSTIEGNLMVAEKYSTPMVIRKCSDFLLNFSEMILKKKLQLAGKYKLGEVKKRCMSEIKTVADVHSILSDGVNDLDPSIINELLEKIRRFNNQ